jgi:hypothetical protein
VGVGGDWYHISGGFGVPRDDDPLYNSRLLEASLRFLRRRGRDIWRGGGV